MTPRILVTGASIAGNTVAFWLGRAGCDVTVVERAARFREGGQNVDVRGPGRTVLRRMGLEAQALAQGTGEVGTAWVDETGRARARFGTDAATGDGPTAEMEILRGDLARLIYEPARAHAAYRFGDTVAGLTQDADGVDVTFASGQTARYTAVIVAEGAGSATRERAFPGETTSRWMDLAIAYLTIPRARDDDDWWRWYNAPGGLGVSLRPDPHGTARAMLILQQPPGGEEGWPRERQHAYLRARFAQVGWAAPRVLASLDATDDFYFDVLRQVRMPRWSRGRVVLTGDAAWCATPLAGIGTTLAVTGAYVLAGEFSRHADPARAFAAYEALMRPHVARAHAIPKLAPRLMNPHTRLGIRALHGALALASRPGVRALSKRFSGGARREEGLPDYESERSPV